MPFMEIKEIAKEKRDAELVEQLTVVWEHSVRATHVFLTEEGIEELRPVVPQAIQGVERLVVVCDGEEGTGEPVGFMGVQGHFLEMLFLDPAIRGQGLGRKLLEFGFENYGVNELTVNEQNPGACAFYEHMGFRTVSRSDLDDAGRPYPLLTMRRAESAQ